jgi:hypothetical protein
MPSTSTTTCSAECPSSDLFCFPYLELNREQYREPEDTVATATRDEATRLLPFFYHNRAATFICLAFNPFDRMPERLVEPIGELPALSILLSLVVPAFVPK